MRVHSAAKPYVSLEDTKHSEWMTLKRQGAEVEGTAKRERKRSEQCQKLASPCALALPISGLLECIEALETCDSVHSLYFPPSE